MVKDCFKKWVQANQTEGIPLAHDGMRNIYATQMLLDTDEKWTTVELPSGRKRPHVYMYPVLFFLKNSEISPKLAQKFLENPKFA